MELSKIKGCGVKTIEYLNKLNIYNYNDLIRYYPYRYNVFNPVNINDIKDDSNVVISGIVTSNPRVFYIKRNLNRLTFTLETNNINIKVVIFNRAFLLRNLTIAKKITLIGKYDKFKNTFTASDIKLYGITKTEVEPVYHLVSGIKSATLFKCINNALEMNEKVDEIIPSYLNDEYKLLNTIDAIREIHNPTDIKRLKSARIKLKYEELFEFMFKINLIKYRNQIFDNYVLKNINDADLNEILKLIPFELTNDQLNAIKSIQKDFNDFKRMNRLILGDVGSGKTIVSFVAILMNYKCGYQSAMLAPTEVLARQHYENFIKLFGDLDIKVEILTGSLTKKEKNEIKERLAKEEIDILIGTHAMLEDDVSFGNIGLVITDEQHRFGVNQRKSLQNKGRYVDVLYMSATPIPRTYALTIYGDMDITMIKEKPSGRKEIKTNVYKFKDINKVIEELTSELDNGYQAYIVSPLIEEENDLDINDLKKIEDLIKEKTNNRYKIGLLHGKLKNEDKDKIMNDFKNGKYNILISTTVIEVGVDVKNATIMIVFNAERFGLATLHQLRGRVGRNSVESKCLLLSDHESERLKILEESNDGFYISERDLELRGTGDLFGIRQSGDMAFKIANLKTDYRILLQCKNDVEQFIQDNIENNFRNYEYYNTIVSKIINTD